MLDEYDDIPPMKVGCHMITHVGAMDKGGIPTGEQRPTPPVNHKNNSCEVMETEPPPQNGATSDLPCEGPIAEMNPTTGLLTREEMINVIH